MSLRRREVVKNLLEKRGGLLVVAGLGSTAWDITAAGDHDLSFPLWGAMGQAAMLGFGPRARAAEAPGAGHHRRRRDADGDRLARHHRRAAAEEPDRGR